MSGTPSDRSTVVRSTPGSAGSPRRASLARAALLAVAIAAAAGVAVDLALTRFLVTRAEERVQTALHTNRALHRYVQEVLHPEFYRAQRDGQIAKDYYAPQLFSSSYIVRRTQALENEERARVGLPLVSYRMGAENPRNPVNLADAREAALLREFDADRSKRSHREIVTLDGKEYLDYALPFLETGAACQRCHGPREAAPTGVAALYPEGGGYGEPVGHIRAIESIRIPIAGELRVAWAASGALAFGALSFVGLAFASASLRRRVRERTRSLVAEVAERRRAEEEVVRLKDALSGLVDAMPSALVGLDDAWRVTLWNRQAQAISGVAPDAALGRPAGELFPPLAPHLEALREEEPRAGGARVLEKVAVERGGAQRTYDLLHYPLSAGGVRGGVLRIDDVTERAHLEAHLAQAQRLEAIGTLAGGIAHDFNNILAAIEGHAAVALEQPVGGELREDLEAIRDASRRATGLTRQILTFSRQGPQEPRPVRPAEVAREALRLLRATIPATVEIRAHLECQAAVIADPGELHRILVNLCTNAALAMKDGGVLEVSCGPAPIDGAAAAAAAAGRATRWVRLTVRDTGAGMTPEVKARIFEPFFTTRKEEGGTGLGLSTVHGIVERLGGSVSVASEPGRGTTFELLLPFVDAGDGAPPPCEPHGAPGQERVLFVDDEEAICRVAERHLSRLGYRVRSHTSAAEALRAFEAAPGDWDVVVTDMTMPELTGEALARRVKEVRPGLPVVLCTGYSEKISAERARSLGIDEFVLKPVVGPQLSRVIRRVVDRAASREGAAA